MDYKQLAQAAIQLTEGASITASRQNVTMVANVHNFLAAIANGQLTVQEKDDAKQDS